MPYCIIFFTLCIVFDFIFYIKRPLRFILLATCSILFILSLFLGDIDIAESMNINDFLILGIIVSFIALLFKINLKDLFIILLITAVVGGIYSLLIKHNIFLSIDYSIIFSLLLLIIPLLFFSKNIFNAQLFVFTSIIIISIIEYYFWLNELDYARLNILNFLQLLAILFTILIIVNNLVRLFINFKNKRLNKISIKA